jgi:hypothetical protein
LNITNQTPFQVEVLPFIGPGRKCFLTVIVKGTFTLRHRTPSLAAEEQMPIAFGDEPFDPENGGSTKFEADIAPFKPRADVVLIGHAYPPRGLLVVNGIDVSLRVEDLHRVLRVFGDRTWHYTSLIPDHFSRPKPFTRMSLVYERAFGGIDRQGGGHCPYNLVGRGYFSKLTKKTVNGSHLPNIEDPKNIIHCPKDHPFPAGFGFFSRSWEPRCSFLGTYDEMWRKNRAPDLPEDFSYDYYNGAHPDLQIEGYLRGDEAVELLNLAPDSEIRFKLPGIIPVCRVEKSYGALTAYLESQDTPHPDLEQIRSYRSESSNIALNLDTLCLMPDEARYYVLWRGRADIHDMTALEVETITIT